MVSSRIKDESNREHPTGSYVRSYNVFLFYRRFSGFVFLVASTGVLTQSEPNKFLILSATIPPEKNVIPFDPALMTEIWKTNQNVTKTKLSVVHERLANNNGEMKSTSKPNSIEGYSNSGRGHQEPDDDLYDGFSVIQRPSWVREVLGPLLRFC